MAATLLAALVLLHCGAPCAAGDGGSGASDDAASQPDLQTIPVAAESGAQTVDPIPVQLDVIKVTADKRARRLEDVRGSVGALQGLSLKDLGARGAEDYVRLVPGVSLNKEAVDRSDYPIRGIATETRFQTTQRATGIYIDEIPMSDPFIPLSQPDLGPFDLERIEVLKGPQATLFGSTALAGAIHYITRRPHPGAFEGRVTGSWARMSDGNEAPYGAAMLNLPIGDSAALRGVAVQRRDPGYIDDTRSGREDVGATEQRQHRAQGSWLVSDRLDVAATYVYQDGRQDDLPYADQRSRLEHANANGPSPTRSAFTVGNLAATYELPWATLLSSSSLLSKDVAMRLESSRTLGTQPGGAPLYITVDATGEGITQEVRLTSNDDSTPWTWLVGGWYLRYDLTFDQHIPNPPPPPPLPPPGEETELAVGHFKSRGVETALFGDITRQLGKGWSASAGGRLYRTDLRSHNVTGGLLVAATSGQAQQINDDELREQGFNPRLSLSFELNDAASIYALVSRGFRFGGIQLSPPSQVGTVSTKQDNTYKSDTLWNYEVGTRTEWLDRRMRVDVTAFYGDWKDLQITRVDDLGLFTFVQNVGAAHTQGLELSTQVLLWDGLTWLLSATFIDARTDTALQTADGEVPPDTRLPGTPRFQTAALVDYSRQFGSWVSGVSLLYSHVGRSYNNLFGTEQLGDYSTLSAHARLALPGLPLRPEIALGATNVTDVRGIAGAFADPATSAKDFYFINPRTVTLTTTLSF